MTLTAIFARLARMDCEAVSRAPSDPGPSCPVRAWGLVGAICLLLLVGAVGTASAQPLAEIARREAARRSAVDEPAKTYTNDDLRPYPSRIEADDSSSEMDAPSASGVAGAPADAAAPAGETSADDVSQAPDAEPVRDEAYWRGRIGTVRSQLQRNELFLEALESRINALTTDFVNTDDPAQRALVAIDRQQVQTEMDRVRDEIQRLGDEMREIEDEARRASAPPGWLR